MSTKIYLSYEEAAADYLANFNNLLQVPGEAKGPVTRSAGEVSSRGLIERADAIADISAGMIPLAKAQLETADSTLREGLTGQLAAQAAAEFQLAAELLQITEREPAELIVATRGVRGAALQDAIRSLEKVMATPAAKGLAPLIQATRTAVAAPVEIESAKKALREAALSGVSAITERVREHGEAIVLDLVTQTEWRAVIEGAAMLSKDIAEKLESLKQGVSALLKQAVTAAVKTLLNVFDKIMVLLGKDLEDKARKQVSEWLERIKKEQNVALIDEFVDQLYGKAAFEKALDGWLANTSADTDKVNQTANVVREVATKFAVLAGYLGTAESAVVLAKRFLKFPQVLAVTTGIQVALLAVVVYSGYDYIGYRELKFPNLAKGVAEVVRENLVIPA
jgi:hypothetical protein